MAAPRQLSGRGLAYWSDGRDERILYVTPGYRLIALDAKTGVPVASFGKDGIVDLKLDDDQTMDLVTGEVGLHATPVVAGNTVIVGAAHLSGGVPRSKTNVKGYVRGFDVKTGKRLWIFHTIPKPGEYGNDSWEKDSYSYTGNAGVWAQISVDAELGMAYLHALGHRDYHKIMQTYHTDLMTMAAIMLDRGVDVVMDRHWPSEFIYGDILRPELSGLYDRAAIMRMMAKLEPTYIFCSNGNGFEEHIKSHDAQDHRYDRATYGAIAEMYHTLTYQLETSISDDPEFKNKFKVIRYNMQEWKPQEFIHIKL